MIRRQGDLQRGKSHIRLTEVTGVLQVGSQYFSYDFLCSFGGGLDLFNRRTWLETESHLQFIRIFGRREDVKRYFRSKRPPRTYKYKTRQYSRDTTQRQSLETIFSPQHRL